MLTAGLLIGLSFSLASGRSLADEEIVTRAQSAFLRGVELRNHPAQARPLFLQAALHYAELRRRGYQNVDLYRDEGNAFLLANELPRAILAYRRGLQWDPSDSALAVNLAFAREQVAYSSPGSFGRPPDDRLPQWLPRASPRRLVAVTAIVYALFWFTLARSFMTRRPWRFAFAIVALGSFVALSVSLFVEDRQIARNESHPVVVLATDGVVLRKGNGLSYPPRSETRLNRGVEARLLFDKGDWLQIELAGGEVGWVARASALVDAPQLIVTSAKSVH